MERTPANFLKFGVILLIMSVIPATFFSSLFTTFRYGFSQEKLDNFDPFHVWGETPFVLGFISSDFEIVMGIFGVTALVFTAGGLAITFPRQLNAHGSAKWAEHRKMKQLGYFKKHKDIVGAVFGKTTLPKNSGLYFTNGEQPHCLISAPTRAGKGVSVVIPTLLTFEGSIIALDVKGELFENTSRARQAMGDKVFKFSPLSPDGRTHCYNPLDQIATVQERQRFTEARRLASNLIIAKNKGAESFVDGSRDLFAAGIMRVIELGTPTIGAVYDLFSAPEEKTDLFSRLASETESREAASIFNNMAGNDLKIITSYTSILDDGGLKLWADSFVRAATDRSDFDIQNLRRYPTSVYLTVPPNDLDLLAPLMRLLFQQIVSAMQKALPQEGEDFPVLFLMDEFRSLGKLEAIETAITTIAGYGGRFMFVVQSLANITDKYGREGRENILGNCGVQVFMATTDSETPELISKAIGDYTRKSRSKTWSTRELTGGTIQEREEGARLIRPEEIRLLPDDDMIILVKGQSPVRLKKVRFFMDKVLKRIYEAQTGDLLEPDIAEERTALKATGGTKETKSLRLKRKPVSGAKADGKRVLQSLEDMLPDNEAKEIDQNEEIVGVNLSLLDKVNQAKEEIAKLDA